MKALDLRPDGTVVIRDGSREWVLRRPTIGEWRDLVEATEAVDDERNRIAGLIDDQGEPVAVAERLRQINRLLLGTKATETEPARAPAYARAMSETLAVLGGYAIAPEDLPSWCSQSDALTAIIGHWRAVPLDLSPEPTISPPSVTQAPNPDPLSSPTSPE